MVIGLEKSLQNALSLIRDAVTKEGSWNKLNEIFKLSNSSPARTKEDFQIIFGGLLSGTAHLPTFEYADFSTAIAFHSTAAYDLQKDRILINPILWDAGPLRRSKALIEGLGYAIDARLNGASDSMGAEGLQFARWILREFEPSHPALNDLKLPDGSDHDKASLLIGGSRTRVEPIDEIRENYGDNLTVDRIAIAEPIALSDPLKRDGIVYLRIYTEGGDENGLAYLNNPASDPKGLNDPATILTKDGSGIYLGDGYILTAAHVVKDAGRWNGKVIGEAYFGATVDSNRNGNAAYKGFIQDTWIYPGYKASPSYESDLAIVKLSESPPNTISVWRAGSAADPTRVLQNNGTPIQAFADLETRYSIYGYGLGLEPNQFVTLSGPDANYRAWGEKSGTLDFAGRMNWIHGLVGTIPGLSDKLTTMYDHTSTLSTSKISGDLPYASLRNLEVTSTDSGGPVVGPDGIIYGIVTNKDSGGAIYTAAGVNMIGHDELRWIQSVRLGMVRRADLGVYSLPDNQTPPSSFYTGLPAIGFASFVNDRFSDKLFNAVKELPPELKGRLWADSDGPYGQVWIATHLANASNVEVTRPITIAVTARNITTDKTQEVHRFTLPGINGSSLNAPVAASSSFRLSTSTLPDFYPASPSGYNYYEFRAIIDPDREIDQITGLVNSASLGVHTVGSLKDRRWPTDITFSSGFADISKDPIYDPEQLNKSFPINLVTEDPDRHSRFSYAYTFVSGKGDIDNDAFEIVRGESWDELHLKVIPGQAIKSQYNIRIRTTDPTALSLEKNLTLHAYTPIEISQEISPNQPALGSTDLGYVIKSAGGGLWYVRDESDQIVSGTTPDNSWTALSVMPLIGYRSPDSEVYELYFKNKDTGEYRRWMVEFNGRFSRSENLSRSEFLHSEDLHGRDLDGDGTKGLEYRAVTGKIGMAEVGLTNLGYAVRKGIGAPVLISSGSSSGPLSLLPRTGLIPLAATASGSGYNIYLKNGPDNYSRLYLDSTGMRNGKDILSLKALRRSEEDLNFDLDRDGYIGPNYALLARPLFGAKKADRIINFNPAGKDRIQIDVADFGDNASETFLTVRDVKAFRKSLALATDFVYFQATGGLYFNENSIQPGFGKGGLFMILENKPKITIDNIEFM